MSAGRILEILGEAKKLAREYRALSGIRQASRGPGRIRVTTRSSGAAHGRRGSNARRVRDDGPS